MICLSIRQPWAWLIVNGWKNIENREWPTRFRGRFLVHASKGMTRGEYDACRLFMAGFTSMDLPPMEALERGGIVGEAVLLDCVRRHDSEWFCGPWGFVLDEARPLPFEPLKGALGFFRHNADDDLSAASADKVRRDVGESV
jgi:hypothetical protein